MLTGLVSESVLDSNMFNVVYVVLRNDQKAPEFVIAVVAGNVRLLNAELVM